MSQHFDIRVASDPEYEDLIAEIYTGDEFVLVISQEAGYDSLDIEIHPRVAGSPWKFKLTEIEAAIAAAKNRLWELRKNPDVPT